MICHFRISAHSMQAGTRNYFFQALHSTDWLPITENQLQHNEMTAAAGVATLRPWWSHLTNLRRKNYPDVVLGEKANFYSAYALLAVQTFVHSYSVGLLIRFSSHDCSCPLAPCTEVFWHSGALQIGLLLLLRATIARSAIVARPERLDLWLMTCVDLGP